MNSTRFLRLLALIGWTWAGMSAARAECYEANGWRIEKTVQDATPSNVSYYIHLERTGPDAGLVAIMDARDPATTDGYGDDAYPAPSSGGGTANTIVWTQDMSNGASAYAYLTTTLKSGLATGTRIVNTASVTDSNGTTSVKQVVWVGRDNDTTRASGSAGTCRDPVNTRTGEYVYDPGTDFDLGGPLPLRFTRRYASRLDDPGTEWVRSALGPGWMHNFDVQLVRQDPAAADRSFFVILEGGKIVPFTEMEDGTWQLNLTEPLTPYALKSDGADVWFCDPDQGLLYRFDDADRAGAKEIVDRNGNSIAIGRRADGLATNAADGLGRELRFEYSASSNLVRVTDGMRAVSFGYGAHGELVVATNVLGQTTTFAYDPTNSFVNGNGALMTSATYPRGNAPLVQTYDADGRVVRQADAFSNAATFAYGMTNLNSYGIVTEPDGAVLRHEYDSDGRLYKAYDAYSNYFQYGFSGSRDALGSLRDRRGNQSAISRDYETRRVYRVQDRIFAWTGYGHREVAQTFTNRDDPARTVAFRFFDLWVSTNVNTGNTSTQWFFRDARGNVTGHVDRAEQRWTVEINARGQPTSIVDPRGGTQSYAYNADGTLASASDSDVGATTFIYDALRRQTGIRYPDGSSEGWGLDARDRMTAHTNPAGGATTFEYDANGNLVRTTDPLGYQTGSSYDAMDRRTNRWDSLGTTATTVYNGMGQPATVTYPYCTNIYGYDPRGWGTNVVCGTRTWTRRCDPEGNPTNVVSPGGNTNRYLYNTIGWRTAWYDPLYEDHRQTATWTYDYRGNPTRTKNQMNETTSFTWNRANRLIAVTNAAGHGAWFAYDAAGNRTTAVDCDGNTNTCGYTPMGRLAATTNALGETTRHEYDTAGRPIRATYADGTRTETAYDAAGRPVRWTDAGTNVWGTTWNARNVMVISSNPAGGTTLYAYNLDGTLQGVSDSDVGFVSNRYDAARRRVETVWPGGASVQYAYNEHGERTGVTDALGNPTTFAFDADGRLIAMVDPLGHTNRWSYDAAGRITNAADRTGGNTSWEYDLAGRLTAATDPTGVRTDFSRDANGRVQSWSTGGYTWQIERNRSGHPLALQTPLGIRTEIVRDALHRATRITNGIGETTTISYDSRGRVAAIADPAGRTTQTTYDPRGLPATIARPDSNVVAYAWNSIGSLERLTDFNGAEWTFAYSPMGRLQTATDPLLRATRYAYDADGRLASVAYPDGGSATNSRDANGQTVRIQCSGGPDLQFQRDAMSRITNANDVARTYDAEGRILSETHAGTAFGATYDAAGRLAAAACDDGAFEVAYQYSTGYGNAGVLTSVSDSLTGTQIYFGYDNDLRLRTLSLPNGETITATWDDVNRLTRLQSGDHVDLEMSYDLSGRMTNVVGYAPLDPSGHVESAISALAFDAASQISTPGYAHDACGRVTATPEKTFAWDGASRPTNANGAVCAYDGFGQLRTRAAGGNTNRFFYQPAVAGAPLAAEKDAASGAALRYYVWTPGGRLLYMIDAEHGNAVYFYHFDATGNTLALVDTNKAVAAAYAYDPYGRILARTGTVAQPFTYSGAWGVRQDGTDGTLYQMRARWYDAAIGRFLSPEPLWPLLGQPKALNPYQYAGGDPIRFIDPGGTIMGLQYLFLGNTKFTDEQLDAYLEGGYVGLAALLLRDVDLKGMNRQMMAMGLAMTGVTEDNVEAQLHARFERRKAEHLARHPAPCHAQPFDVQPQRPTDPAQDYVARLGRVPALDAQIVRYQPGAANPPAQHSVAPVDRTAADLATGLFSPEALWDAQIEWHRTHPGQSLPRPLYDPPLPTGPQAGLTPRQPLTEFTATDIAAEIFFGPRALWESALPPAVRRYSIPEVVHQHSKAAAPPVPPAPNPGNMLDWMFGPDAVLDVARSAAAASPPEPDRFQGRNYPALMRDRNAAFKRVNGRLQAGDTAGAREAMNDLKQAERDLADYGRKHPFAPLYEE